MIRIFNPSRLTAQPFFQDLIAYLDGREETILRDIKRDFPGVDKLDKKLESYIQAGYILRADKHYYLTLPFLDSLEGLELDQEVFIREESPLYKDLLALTFETRLTNQTNQAVLIEQTDFARDRLTLANYFYKLEKGYALSEEQQELYEILGDVRPEYALKYMTTFLLKYLRKEELLQKRRDIFVDSLVVLGYIKQHETGKYQLLADFDKENLLFSKS